MYVPFSLSQYFSPTAQNETKIPWFETNKDISVGNFILYR